MNRTILFLYIIISSTFCYASNMSKMDSVHVWHEVYENDTIIFEEIPPFVFCGLKQFQNETVVNYGSLDPETLNAICNEYIRMYTSDIIKDVLSGYGKKTCSEILNQHKASNGKRAVMFIRVRLDMKGTIVAVQFCYHKSLSCFFANKDIIRNSDIVVSRGHTPILMKSGIVLSPWITFPIGSEKVQEFLLEP